MTKIYRSFSLNFERTASENFSLFSQCVCATVDLWKSSRSSLIESRSHTPYNQKDFTFVAGRVFRYHGAAVERLMSVCTLGSWTTSMSYMQSSAHGKVCGVLLSLLVLAL